MEQNDAFKHVKIVNLYSSMTLYISSHFADCVVEWEMARDDTTRDNADRNSQASERRHVYRLCMISAWLALCYLRSVQIQAVT